MKTPDEIKNGLNHCSEDGHKQCPYNYDCNMADGFSVLAYDANAYIQQLENHIDELTEKVTQPKWISVSDRLPDNEVDVLVCVTRKNRYDPSKYIRFIAKAFHTDGKTNTEHSCHTWSTWYTDMDYDEEADAYIIPEGWWETVDYADEFSAVDDFITHWMPLPEPPKEAK